MMGPLRRPVSRLPEDQTAVDGQGLSGDRLGAVGAEEGHGLGDVVRGQAPSSSASIRVSPIRAALLVTYASSCGDGGFHTVSETT